MKTPMSTSCLVGLVLWFSVLASPNVARACHEGQGVVTFLGGALMGATLQIPGMVTAVHNGASLGEVTTGWQTAGYMLGVLNLLAASVFLAVTSGSCEQNGQRYGDDPTSRLAFAIPGFVIGASNLGILIYSSVKQGRTKTVSLVPMLGRGTAGVVAGVGLRILSF